MYSGFSFIYNTYLNKCGINYMYRADYYLKHFKPVQVQSGHIDIRHGLKILRL